jgi:hypothetical protein
MPANTIGLYKRVEQGFLAEANGFGWGAVFWRSEELGALKIGSFFGRGGSLSAVSCWWWAGWVFGGVWGCAQDERSVSGPSFVVSCQVGKPPLSGRSLGKVPR